jgi:7-cyano-7-deazaguanine synthase
MKHIIHCLSGGMDSVVMLYDLRRQGCQIHCAIFDYGQNMYYQESAFARDHAERLKLLCTINSIPKLRGSGLTDEKGGWIVPNRNAILLGIAVNLAVAAGAEAVTFAANAEDESEFPDCRMAFVQTFNNMLRTAEIGVEVCAPYIDKSKKWIAARGRELGVNLSETWSCYLGGVEHCGQCAACKKREAALK